MNFEHSLIWVGDGIKSVNSMPILLLTSDCADLGARVKCRSTLLGNSVEVVMLKVVGRIGPATNAD